MNATGGVRTITGNVALARIGDVCLFSTCSLFPIIRTY